MGHSNYNVQKMYKSSKSCTPYELSVFNARMKSVKYFRKFLVSRSRSFVAKSVAVSGGQPWEGRKTETQNWKPSSPRALVIVCMKFAIS